MKSNPISCKQDLRLNLQYHIRRSDSFSETIYRDPSRAQRFQTLIVLAFQTFFGLKLTPKGRESYVVNFMFLHYKTTKLGPQRITVKSLDAS